MAPKIKIPVGNIVGIILLGIIVFSGIVLALFLYLSPLLH